MVGPIRFLEYGICSSWRVQLVLTSLKLAEISISKNVECVEKYLVKHTEFLTKNHSKFLDFVAI